MSLNTSLIKFLVKVKSLLFFPILCLIFFLILFFINNFFLIKNVQLISDRNFSLINKDKLIKKNLFFINKDRIAKEIIKENFFVKTATVNKVWPNSIKISVSFYKPCVSLIVSNGFFDLSCDGRILQKTRSDKTLLPVINYYQKLNNSSFQTGEWIDYKDIKQALFFVNKLKQLNIIPLAIDIKGQDVILFNLIDDKKIIFSNNKDRETQEYQLELIIRQFKIEGKDFKKIDLRFNKPIVEF